MINKLVAFLEGLDPLFNSVIYYKWPTTAILFMALYFLTRNVFALYILCQIVLSKAIYIYVQDIELLNTTSQIIMFGMFSMLCRKNPLIFLAYLILLSRFVLEYIANSINLKLTVVENGEIVAFSEIAYNTAMIVYYLYFLILLPVLYMMIKGLFSEWGKGYGGGRLHNSYNWLNGDNHYLLGCNIHRFKRLFKVSNKRA